jgi:hypothetical protein
MGSFAGVYDVLCSSCCSRIKMACFYSRMKIDRLNALPYNTIDFDVYKLNFEQQTWEPVKC